MQELEKILEEIEQAKREPWYRLSNYDVKHKLDGAINRIIDIIRKHMNDGWIPVEERLPEDDRMVLVTCQTKRGIRSVNRAYCDGAFWHGSGSMSGVIAWRSLPDPYRPERSEGECD